MTDFEVPIACDRLQNMKKVHKGITYDDSSESGILEYAKQIENKTLREVLDISEEEHPIGYSTNSKGTMGVNVEKHYFDIPNNNRQAPDFPKTGIELKTTGLIYTKDNQCKAKERLSITNINWMTISHETFDDSHLIKKLTKLLIMAYDYDEKANSVFDMVFRIAAIWTIPNTDYPQLLEDWNVIVSKVKAGKAHEISSKDTVYLEASTTGIGHGATTCQEFSDIRAKPRRWALKKTYLTTILSELLGRKDFQHIERTAEESGMSLFDLVEARFKPYLGKSEDELKEELGINSKGAKQFYALLTKKILGISDGALIEEFAKAGVTVRTVRRKKSGAVRESVSFPAMDYCKIIKTEWEDSTLFTYITSPFLFVVFQESEDGTYMLQKIVWWTPSDDVIEEAHQVYDLTKTYVKQNNYTSFPGVLGKDGKSTRIHVRPHGTKNETCLTPQGTRQGKKSFWITNTYVRSILD